MFLSEYENSLLKNDKKIISDYCGKPDKYYLNELLKYSFNLYPLNHSFNKKSINKFIEESDSQIKEISKKIIHYTDYISFENFLLKVNITIYDLLSTYITFNNKNPILIYLGSKDEMSDIVKKSNYWIYNYIKEFIKYYTNDLIKVKLIYSLHNDYINNNDIIVLIDDCIYSGQQMGLTIESLNNINHKILNFFMLVPFITIKGITNINDFFKSNHSLDTSKLIFSKYVYNPKTVDSILTPSEITIFKFYYSNFLNNLHNNALIYFDHKLADTDSTITPFYLGIVPSNDNYLIIIEHFKNIKSIKTNHIISLEKKIELIKSYEKKLYTDLNIIPIINNCSHYINDINLMNPKCPAPPYKDFFKEFSKLKKTDKYNSLNTYTYTSINKNKIKNNSL